MFDFFRKYPEYKVPTPTWVSSPPVEEHVLYSIGVTNDSRITIKMGYSELTMDRQGVDNLIEQLQVFRDQLPAEDEE